jgi:cholesterol transport system auxiliary component
MRTLLSLVLLGITLLIFSGCGSNQSYMLSAPQHPAQLSGRNLPVIGVETITLPSYMQRGKIAIQRSPTLIAYSDNDMWVEDMDESLTRQLIFALQKSFRHPEVYSYPWGLSKPAGIRVSVAISRFIAYGDKVYLDASWKIVDARRGRVYGRLYSVSVPAGQDIPSIVVAMNRAFGKMSRAIAEDILKAAR